MDASAFMNAFFARTSDLVTRGTASNWTALTKTVLWEIGTENEPKFTVNCKPFVNKNDVKVGHKEVMIDFLYFPREEPNTERTLRAPAVAIEHENYWEYEETRKDFFKICLCNVPLGVIIGYHEDSTKSEDVGNRLVDYYTKWWKTRRIMGNEVLIIMGWKHREPPRKWHSWLLSRNADEWVYRLA